MNYMPIVVKMLGIELNEEFELLTSDGYEKFSFSSEHKLVDSEGYVCQSLFYDILRGDSTIKKLPWKPKEDDDYYFVDANGGLSSTDWRDHAYDYILYNTGNCFRTKEEITSGIKERILKEMKEKYENS